MPTWWLDHTPECTPHTEICPLHPQPRWMYWTSTEWKCRMCKKNFTDDHEMSKLHLRNLDYMAVEPRPPREATVGSTAGASSSAPPAPPPPTGGSTAGASPPVPPPPGIAQPIIRFEVHQSQIGPLRRFLRTVLDALPPPDNDPDAPQGDVGGRHRRPADAAPRRRRGGRRGGIFCGRASVKGDSQAQAKGDSQAQRVRESTTSSCRRMRTM